MPLANYPAGFTLMAYGEEKQIQSPLTVKDILDEQIAYKLA
ncbi:MAG: hypothetical protein PHQ35_06660 [Phycisphaerae bacterium]|nr:hypothetical protein [Phycisphaerae bacterium]MDD5381140.1 hypothetical protein [Phycisphaerae bacterium]